MKPNKLVAIIRDVESEDVTDIVQALIEEGINDVEISLSNEEKGLTCIKTLSKNFDSQTLRLGAGTVLTEKQIEQVMEAGGQYIITPGWNKELVKKALEKNLPVYPGVFTPGEIAEAIELGIEYFKLFPINGINEAYLKALRGPFPSIEFMGVGGITPTNLSYYSELGINYFGIGSELVSRGATKNDVEKIRAKAKDFVYSLRQVNSINV